MYDQETVIPEQDIDLPSVDESQEAQQVEQEETQVPLHALQKERRKRQEAELEAKFYREKHSKAAEPEDDSRYESATREDLGKVEEEIIRKVEEKRWIRENPERAKKINEDLPEFLKLRPNLASAIDASTNRYEEAWELMSKLSPKQQEQLSQKQQKPQAPGSPAGIPKAAALSDAVDLMNMSDTEFNQWRNQRRGRK